MRFCPRCGSRYEHERFCPEDGVPTQELPDSVPSMDALLGTVVDGRYRIDMRIGEGGMGVVYKATHTSLNKVIALKVLRGEMAKDAEVVQRFVQEAQSASSIGHENIIDISDFGRLPDGTVYFVMEYLKGNPLNDLIKRGGSIPVADAVQILRQIASALGAAHQRGIVHRDLKPDNIYLVQRGELTNFVKVLDFGIAKVGGASNKLTRTGMVFGTPHYMSPEQAAGQSVDARTDLYALGVIMYEMFTGRVPFDADTFMAVLTKHMFEKPEPMTSPQAGRQLGALEQITMRALEKKPENRYQTMQELVEDLDRVVGGGRPRALTPATPSPALADALEPRSKSEMNLEQQIAVPGSGKAKLWWAAGGACAVLASLLVLVLRSTGDSSAAAKGAPSAPPPIAAVPVPAPGPPVVPMPPSSPSPGGAPTEQAAVTVQSVPSGATLVLDGAIVGTTPAMFPRPKSGSRTLELRLDGYQRETLLINADTQSVLKVPLRKREVARKPVRSKAEDPKPQRSEPQRRRRGQSEVVDPWAD
jgi:eukaryotic-like serine/threonine-protein kinase